MRFENTQTYGFQAAFRGMRNPLESWDKSDSKIKILIGKKQNEERFEIGEKDLELAQRLIAGGNEHAKFLRQIAVWVDITAPLYFWSECDTYKVGTTANSTSTMHKLGYKEFREELFETRGYEGASDLLQDRINRLNAIRNNWLQAKENGDTEETNRLFRLMKAELPTSYLQTRTWSANYAVLRNMYFQRRNHRLSEWSVDFMIWMSDLPYARELIMYENKD